MMATNQTDAGNSVASAVVLIPAVGWMVTV
jgi:hypothetical protein